MLVVPKFAKHLNPRFVEKFQDQSVPWGPIGYIVEKRTYARMTDWGVTEEWWQTCARSVNGLIDIGAIYTHEEAEQLFWYMFNLKGTPAGRPLWQLGTSTVERLGGDSLTNCWVVLCNEPVDPFTFTFNELMLGGGVGFNIMPENVYEIPPVKYKVKVERVDDYDCDYIVTDNREGWVGLLEKVLQSFFYTGKDLRYDTRCIRPRGRPISGFGGTASGPEELVKGIGQIANILRSRTGRKLSPTDCLDIFNIIGSIVVAGNVRRSAEIGIGSIDDHEFLTAKDWSRKLIPSWRQMANLTIETSDVINLPEDYWRGYEGKGEAYGLYNQELCRHYGRLIDGYDYRPDIYIIAPNPCVTSDTWIQTNSGAHEVKDLINKQFIALNDGEPFESTKLGFFHNGIKAVFKITTHRGYNITLTGNHKLEEPKLGWTEVNNLSVGDSLVLQNHSNKNKYIDIIINIKHAGYQDVFDCQIPKANRFDGNGFSCHNCGEIPEESHEACNLAEIYLPNIIDVAEFANVTELIFKGNKAISCLPYWHPKSREVISRNHRIGIGITGVLQAPHITDAETLDAIYNHLEEVDTKVSREMGVGKSIKLTTVKPSGTLSLLAGVSPGGHAEFAPYYIRRITFAADDPLVRIASDYGYNVEPKLNINGSRDFNTMVVDFPVKARKGVIASNYSALQQLQDHIHLQTYWADNAVSKTIYMQPHEVPIVREWLRENYHDSVKTISFALHKDHGFKQTPYEEITKEQYLELQRQPIDSITDNRIFELIDSQECTSNGCPTR